jgi:hypothetical protein
VDLRSGALRVAGAGLDTPTAAFTFRTDADDDGQNQCQSGGDHWFVIDNAMTNGRPGALLFLSALPDAPPASPVWLGTDAVGTCQQQRWGLSGPPLDAKNYRYNVLVIVP